MNLYSVKVGRGLKLYFERGSRYVVSNNLFHSKNAYLKAVYSEIWSQVQAVNPPKTKLLVDRLAKNN